MVSIRRALRDEDQVELVLAWGEKSGSLAGEIFGDGWLSDVVSISRPLVFVSAVFDS